MMKKIIIKRNDLEGYINDEVFLAACVMINCFTTNPVSDEVINQLKQLIEVAYEDLDPKDPYYEEDLEVLNEEKEKGIPYVVRINTLNNQSSDEDITNAINQVLCEDTQVVLIHDLSSQVGIPSYDRLKYTYPIAISMFNNDMTFQDFKLFQNKSSI